jgi:two-component system phosphate regulon sensor histidine kinase PhoR
MKRSLVWRIGLPFILLILVSVGGISLYFSNYIERQYYSTIHDHLATSARLLATDIAGRFEAGESYSDIQNLIEVYANITDSRVTFIRSDGVVTADSQADPTSMENHLTRPEIQQALDGVEGAEIRFSDTLKRNFYYLAVPVTKDGKITGVVRFARELTQIEGAIQTLRNQILSIGAGIIIVSILLAYLVAESALRPLRKLAKSVQQLKEGDTGVELSSNRRDEIGQLTRSIGEVADQLNNQIAEFQDERSKLEAVLRHMTDAVLIVDGEGKVTLANPAAETLFNTTVEQTMGRSLVEVVRQYQFIELWRASLKTHKQQVSTLETSPERSFVRAIATPLEGSLPGATLLVFQDLTQIRRLETVRRDFVSNVSHELRTPLASLKALAETLQETALEDPPAARRFLQRMEDEIDNLTQLVRELLDLSRIESGRVPFDRRPVNPQIMVTHAVERMQLQAERGGLTLQIEENEPLPEVMADAERIESVLVNLLHNAIKFTPPGGKITAGAQLGQNRVVFFVKDTGVGIQPEDLSRIFERFYKADQSRSGGGTGLGLSIARHTVEAHKGRIWAESKPGEGSTFYFSLPLA